MNYKKELEELIDMLLKEGGSDLHLSEGRSPFIRVSGYLLPLLNKKPLTRDDIEGYLDEFISKEDKQILFSDKEVDFSYGLENKGRFRGNGYFQQGLISVALRLIPKDIKTLEELNLPPILSTFTSRQQGFFLVVGPVGQGKSTTLAAMIEMINKERAEHIITIEDPIEYVYEPKKSIIDQRAVKVDTKDFQTALVSMFRQDVDVVLIGEMRGTETISAAVTAAETGHLVVSTLHTNNAAQTIDRIIDSFPANQQPQIRVQLAGSLAGIFSQRLIPRISGGLIPAYELLVCNNAVANLIREGRTHEINSVIETGTDMGMIDMNRSLAELVRSGDITVENAYAYSQSPKTLERLI